MSSVLSILIKQRKKISKIVDKKDKKETFKIINKELHVYGNRGDDVILKRPNWILRKLHFAYCYYIYYYSGTYVIVPERTVSVRIK